MRITRTLRSFYWSVIFFSVILPSVAVAESAMDVVTGGLSTTASSAGFGSTAMPITTLVGNAINAVLAVLGIVFLGFLVYAGILYLTSTGDKEKVKRAVGIITTSVIGMVIIIAAYAIAYYIMTALSRIVS